MSNHLIYLLHQRKDQLTQWIKANQPKQVSPVNGKLRVTQSLNHKPRFYLVTEDSTQSGRYIRKSEMDIAYKLAQHDYNVKFIDSCKIELALILRLLKHLSCSSPENIYSSFPSGKQQLICPLILSDEEYASQWLDTPFEQKSPPDEENTLKTMKGDFVRSKSELIIADMLYSENIPYRYECALVLSNGRTIYPDFTLFHAAAHKEIYWEHFGMMDNPEYLKHAILKMREYERSRIYLGDRLIVTFETKDYPIDTLILKNLILHYMGE